MIQLITTLLITLTSVSALAVGEVELCRDYLSLAEQQKTPPATQSFAYCSRLLNAERVQKTAAAELIKALNAQPSIEARWVPLEPERNTVTVKREQLRFDTLKCWSNSSGQEVWCRAYVRSCEVEEVVLQGRVDDRGHISFDWSQAMAKRGGCISFD